MQQYICLMKPTGNPRDSSDYGDIFRKHGAYLNELAAQGRLFFAGYTNGETPGELSIAVLNVTDRAEAQEVMTLAPAVKSSFLSFKLEPFEIFISREFSTD